MSFAPIEGVIAPNLTPFNEDLSIATDLYVAHAKTLLAGACAALAPFGTTGEALSVSPSERIEAIKALIDGGVDPKKLIPGTGMTSMTETAELSRACLDLGCAAVMTLPPFYYKGVSEDGLYAYFEKLIKLIDHPALKIFLYHIPQVSGVGLPISLVARLKRDFPDVIVGIKDSGGDLDNTLALLEIDDLIVYPGSELPILETTPRGAPGCISATANLNGHGINEVLTLQKAGDEGGAKAKHDGVREIRMAFQDYAPIPAQKRLLALATGDDRWAIVRPPLESLSGDKGRQLLDELGPDFSMEQF